MVERMDRGCAALIRHRQPLKQLVKSSLPWLAPLGFLALFYFYPLASILQTSFARGDASLSAPERLAAPFLEAIRSASLRGVLRFTVWQASLSTLLTLLFGLPGAYLLARYEFRGKSFILAMTGISFVLPTLVVAAAFNAILGPRGWANLILMDLFQLQQPPIQFVNTFLAILTAHIFYNTTIVLRIVGDYWSHLDPRMEQAAQMLGANRWRTLQHVTLPLLMPALTTAALLIFIFNFTSFGVILLLGGPRFATLEVEIYNQTIGLFNLPLAAALAVIQLVFTLGLTIAYSGISYRLSSPNNLRPRRYTQRRLTTWRSRLLAAAYLSALLSLLVLPLVALVTRSFVKVEPPGNASTSWQANFTLDFYQELSINRRESLFYVPPTTAIGVSLGYAMATIFLALALGLPAAWALARDVRSPGSRFFDPILMLPLGTSAVTLGLGFIIALDRPPLDLRASIMLVPLAHTLVAFPFVVRSLIPSLRSIRPRLRQAASVMGATPFQALRYIDLPIIGRAILVAATFAFAISIGEFGATALIARPEYPTIPVMVYRYISQPGALNYGQALALSTILAMITALAMLAIERFRVADIGEF
jgi:thiamine transport system permease protein